jgi:acyl-CoA thioesterase-1
MTLLTTLAAALILVVQAADDRPVILAFGDSLTAGYGVPSEESYPAQLQRALDARGYSYRVVNQGVPGNTTIQGIGRMSQALRRQPHVVILQFGGNDVANRVPANVTRANLKKMIDTFKNGGTRVFLASRNIPLLAEVAREENVELIPFLDGVAGHPELLRPDGTHPNGDGYAIVVQNVLKMIEPALRK